jgi:HAMP domain-containing protein
VSLVDAVRSPRSNRLPLPAKLFLSYLLVLLVSAVPSFLYVRSRLEDDLLREASRELLERARRTAVAVRARPVEDRPAALKEIAALTSQRLTLVAQNGDVLVDTDVTQPLENHADRPEVKAALQSGHGSASRKSETTGKETLYAAVRLDDGVLRVARPLAEISSVDALITVTRNIQAAAVSVALLLSLVAAVQFVRPLRRVIATAQALGQGDLAARSGVDSNDEVGDTGRALDAMAVELRRRLANAGSGDAVLSQLVDALPVPCVVFEVTGEVLALNGAARTALRVDGPNASRRLKELSTSETFERALYAAEGDGEPEPLDVDVAPGVTLRSTVHVLKRPGTAPLYVLLGADVPQVEQTTLPPVDAVRPRAFSEVFSAAEQRIAPALLKSGVGLDVSAQPSVLVVDVGDRVQQAVACALQHAAQALSGRSERLTVGVTVDATRVSLLLEADPGKDAVDRIRPLLEPLGGGVQIKDGEATLWLPRA